MKVNVLAFGIAKDIFGSSNIEIVVDGNTALDLKQTLEAKYPRLKQLVSYLLAVNNEYVQDEKIIADQDEIAVIPPVSGG